MKRRIFSLLALALLIAVAFVTSQCCVYKEKKVSGRVVDQSTSTPIAGATVMIYWEGFTTTIVDSGFLVLGSTLVQTNGAGEYKALVRSEEGVRCNVSNPRVEVYAYKPGYSWLVHEQDGDVFLVPFVGTRERKLRLIRKASNRIGRGKPGDSPEYRFAKSLYFEAKQLVSEMENVTDHQKSIVNTLRYDAALRFVDPYYQMNHSLRGSLVERHIRTELEGKPRLRY